jgi:hypothetical protein
MSGPEPLQNCSMAGRSGGHGEKYNSENRTSAQAPSHLFSRRLLRRVLRLSYVQGSCLKPEADGAEPIPHCTTFWKSVARQFT